MEEIKNNDGTWTLSFNSGCEEDKEIVENMIKLADMVNMPIDSEEFNQVFVNSFKEFLKEISECEHEWLEVDNVEKCNNCSLSRPFNKE